MNTMVEVYRTNVKNQEQADFLLGRLKEKFPDYRINFDLEDCDNILRVEGRGECMDIEDIGAYLERFGITARSLDDQPIVPHKRVRSN